MPPFYGREDLMCPECGHSPVGVEAHKHASCEKCDWSGDVHEAEPYEPYPNKP